jgi:arylsulfatase A-like enzyme
MNKPNVLVFCVDQMRADHMACAGNSIIRTPNLDRLAARGTLFERSFCNNPICMPARATMFTGLLPRDHGLRINGQSLRKDIPTLAGVLADAGYRTHAAGKLHLTPWVPMVAPPQTGEYPECLQYWKNKTISSFPTPYYGFQTVDFVGGHTSYAYGDYIQWLLDHGGDPKDLTPEKAIYSSVTAPGCYHMSLPEELHYNRYIADSTINLIQNSAQQQDKPFFAWCSFPDPHLPVAPPAPYCNMYDPDTIPLPSKQPDDLDSLPPFYRQIFSGELRPDGQSFHAPFSPEQVQELIALTYGMVSHIDMEIGRVLDELDTSGLSESTLIVFVSDHGDMMGDHGLYWKGPYTYNGCINIPTIVSAPEIPGGTVSDSLISQIDLLPSILDFCAVPLPGSDWREKNRFHWGQARELSLYPGRSWRSILENPEARIHEEVIIENDYLSTGYLARCMVTERYRITTYPGTADGELFDIESDPDELVNLWYSPEHDSLKNELLGQLLDGYSRYTPHYPVPPWNS